MSGKAHHFIRNVTKIFFQPNVVLNVSQMRVTIISFHMGLIHYSPKLRSIDRALQPKPEILLFYKEKTFSMEGFKCQTVTFIPDPSLNHF